MSAFDALDLSADRPRRVIAAGAGLTAVGFLLPWAGSLLGAGSMSGYFAQWGLAGPGHWLILFAVIALAGIAVAPGPLASRSLLVLSVAVGALLVGLVWPYVVGGFGSIGAWTVLVGALVIAAGGLLDRSSRHGPEDPAV
jgi:hypothetical protein